MNKRDGTWLVAVSGGPDSMALLAMCIQSGTKCAVAHVNYHHRTEADEEEAYVRSFCQQHHIPCHVRNEAFEWTGNFESAARNWRYSFFVSVVKEHGYSGIMVAHQEDDLIETYLMQEEKGIEPAFWGLQEEMMYEKVLVYRPLLSYTKQQLQQYCDDQHIRYYIDASNLTDLYTRNRIRHSVVEPMSRFQRDMVLHEIRLKNATKQERLCRVRTYMQDDRVSLAVYRKASLEDRLALLRMVLEKDRADHVTKAFLMETDHVLCTKEDFMIPFRNMYLVQEDHFFFLYMPKGQYSDVYACKQDVQTGRYGTYAIETGTPGVYALTVKEEDFPIRIRSAQAEDKILMRFGTKKVHRFFIDRHIPLYQRSRWPVVENAEGEIILVPGLGCDKNHYSVTPDFNVVQYFR